MDLIDGQVVFECLPFLSPWGNETGRIEEDLSTEQSASDELKFVPYDLFVAIGENARGPMASGMGSFGHGGNLESQNDVRHDVSVNRTMV